jgi:hypothetical protein
VEAEVELLEATETVLVAHASDEGSSVCSGDSGSALLVESDGRLSLTGVLSSSSGSPGSLCTPDGGGEYWVRPSAALTWLEGIIGPCEPVAPNFCTFASRDESTPPCVP